MNAAEQKAREIFQKFRTIQPYSPYTGIANMEAKDCSTEYVKGIIEELNTMYEDFKNITQLVTVFKDKDGFNENMKHIKENQINPYFVKKMFFYQDVLKEIKKI